jgi:putative nucleotidyltransferase with HDIG domain
MNSTEPVVDIRQEQVQRWLHTAVYAVLLGAFVVGGASIIAYDVLIPSNAKVALEEGDVAPQDILAPRSLQYSSDVLTEAKRDAEVAAVRPVYDPPDPGVEAEQSQLARQILDYIENIRYDAFATPEQKREDLEAITELNLDESVIAALLSIEDDTTWRAIDAQVMRLLERVMSGEVREDNIQARRDNLPNLISASYSESEVKVITGLVGNLIRVNTFYNEELTRQAQEEARRSVPDEVRTFVRGQMIIREGEIATSAHIEALDRFGLLKVSRRQVERFVAGLLAMTLVTVVLGAYTWQFYPHVVTDPQFATLLGLVFLLFLSGAQAIDADGRVQPYYFPGAALALLVTTLVGAQLAIVMTMALAALAGFMGGQSLEFAVLVTVAGTLAVMSLGRTERLNAYFVAGGVVAIAAISNAVLFALGLDGPVDAFTLLSQIAGSLANGMLSAALALVGLYLISNVLNIPTSLKIVELMQPNHPLLQRLLREAPGTYQHSLLVANLSELGAQQINANASLVRVAAMYHDVGKILNPHFFVENQADGVNPHDGLDDPWQSARIIIGHVAEGDRLARRYRLPSRIRDFIMEHHGTTQVAYFYQKAVGRAQESGEDVDVADFTYPGPRPQSRETAILMLADGCESSVRGRRPQSKQDIQETVDYIFDTRVQGRQLDDSGLTLGDLRLLRDAFLTALQGVFHPRIAYPGSPGQGVDALPAGDVASLPPGAVESAPRSVPHTPEQQPKSSDGAGRPPEEPVVSRPAESARKS